MANILVTGNAGFIGMHVVLQLCKAGHHVTGIDNINEYYDINLKLGRLQEQGINTTDINYGVAVKAKDNFTFIKLNLEDKEGIETIFAQKKFDFVIHLAAQAGVRYSLENPDAYVNSNVQGFLNMLEACRKFPVKHLVYASSSSVYGLNKTVPFKEGDATEHPISLYAATKKANEMMAHSYAHLFQIPVTGLRFFTVYGPWGRPDMALFKFTKNILEGKPIDIYNHGKMQRDFTYVHDIVNGVVKIMTCPPKRADLNVSGNILKTNESPAPFQILNIGNSHPVNLMDFVEALEDVLGIKANVNMLPMQPGDVTATYASVELLDSRISYKPGTEVKEGIRQFVNWYKAFYNI